MLAGAQSSASPKVAKNVQTIVLIRMSFQATLFYEFKPIWEAICSSICCHCCETEGSEKRFKKRCSAKCKSGPIRMARVSLTAPIARAVLNNEQQLMNKKQRLQQKQLQLQ